MTNQAMRSGGRNVEIWGRGPRRDDETPFRLDNLSALRAARAIEPPPVPALSPPPPDTTWMTGVESPSAVLFSVDRVSRASFLSELRAGTSGCEETPTSVAGHVLLAPLLDASSSRRSRRLAVAAATTIAAALLCLAMILGVVLTEPAVTRSFAPQSEELLLAHPVTTPAAVVVAGRNAAPQPPAND